MYKIQNSDQTLAAESCAISRNRTIVIKMGGSFLDHLQGQKAFVEDIFHLYKEGFNVVIVHGGGKEISGRLKRLGIDSAFTEGYRVTDQETMEEVEMTLSGKVNKDLVLKLGLCGVKAIGISGKDGLMLKVKKKKLLKSGKVIDIGLVGEVETVDISLINLLHSSGYVPVVSPIGYDPSGKTYNINADLAASAIAGALKASKLILMTDVKGVYGAYPDESTFISTMTQSDCMAFLNNGADHKGMKPKLESAIEALNHGAQSVHIINGSEPHSLMTALFSNHAIGTQIKVG